MSELTINRKNIDALRQRAKKINSISESMCTAKWLQSTIYLHNGRTHSCHHPESHSISKEEIQDNPSAIHNTQIKKIARNQMLMGLRPKECSYCWNIEDLQQDHISDRIYKSADTEWSYPFLDRVLANGSEKDITPSYLEVSFDNICNLKCVYCSPESSSKWQEEAKKFGSYPTSCHIADLDWLQKKSRMPIARKEPNQYKTAFWKWWPELYPSLKNFRLTGGEPLLSKDCWKTLDYIIENPNPELNLAINTNLSVDSKLIDKLISYSHRLEKCVRSFDIFTSCEAFGNDAEYIRFGLNYNRFIENIERYLNFAHPNSKMRIMSTFSALSIPSFVHFLADISRLRGSYNQKAKLNRIPIMISYLRWPPFLSAQILPADLKLRFAQEVRSYIDSNLRIDNKGEMLGGFFLEEKDQVDRLCNFILQEQLLPELKGNRMDFAAFLQEGDKRRGTHFSAQFPALALFYNNCLLELNNAKTER